MKRTLIGCIAVYVLAAGLASAADISVPEPIFKAQQGSNAWIPHDWTGFYVGINGGGAWGQSRQTQVLTPSLTTGSFKVDGGLIGGTVGFNDQVDRLVFGLEGDLDWANIRGNTVCRLGAFNCATQSDYLGTARARLGYAWSDQWLAYVTGGAALGDINQSFSPAIGTNNGTISNRVGWTAGGGIQFGFWSPWWSNWSVKIEYLYVDLGTFNCTVACSGIPGQITSTTLKENIFRTGINYRF